MKLDHLIRQLQMIHAKYGDMEVVGLYKPHLKLHKLTFDAHDIIVETPTSKPVLKIITKKWV